MSSSKTKIISVLIAFMMLLSLGLTACGGGVPSSSGGAAAPATSAPATSAPKAPAASAPAASAPAASAPAASAPAGKQTVKVGVCMPFSGTGIRTGEMVKAAINAALKHIDEDKLLQHYDLEMTYYDDLGSPDGCPPAAALLINDGNHIAISNTMTVHTMAVMPMYEEAKVICMGPISGVAAVGKGYDYFYMTTVCDLDITRVLADWIKHEGYQRVFVQARNDEGGMGGAEAFISYVKERSGDKTIVGYELFATDDTDFTAQVLKAKSGDAQVFYSAGTGAANSYTLWKQIRELWADNIILVFNTSMAGANSPQIWGYDDIEGILYQTAYVYDPNNPIIQRFYEDYVSFDPEKLPPAEFPGRCYEAVMDIAVALDKFGSYDVNAADFTEKLNKVMKTVTREGVFGPVDFTAFPDGRSIKSGKLAMWHKDGTATQVWPPLK